LAGVARYWMSGQLLPPAFGAPAPHGLKHSRTRCNGCAGLAAAALQASLLDALDNALSIYPAERPQSVAQMRARLDAAPPAAGGPVSAASTAAPVPNTAVPSSPAPQPAPPAPVAQDLDAVMAFAPDSEPPATSGTARIVDDPSAWTAFARQVSNPRRIAMASGAVLVLLLLIGMPEFRQQHQVGRVLDVLGISRGSSAGDGAAVSASAVGPAAPVTPPIAADGGAAKPTPTEPTAADSPAGDTGSATPATAPDCRGRGSREADADGANRGLIGGRHRACVSASTNRATLADAATAAPAAVAQPPASTPAPTRMAQQHASRAPASPREACGVRTQFSLYRCMQTQCSQRRWASHAQCERLRTTDSVD
jgi:non-specific serine/threonine protein kinase